MQLAEVEARVLEDDLMKRDYTVDTGRLQATEEGRLVIEEGGSYPCQVIEPTDFALTQLLQKTGVPVRYGKRIPRWLMAQNVNYGLEQYGKPLFLRAKGEALRAVLSERYAAFDNIRVVEALSNILPGRAEFEIDQLWLDDRGLMLNIVFPEMTYDVGNGDGKPDILKVGVLVGNSEIGARSVFAVPRLLRLVCSNGMVRWVEGAGGFSMPHMGHGPWEMEEGLAKGIARSAQIGYESLDKIRESIRQEVSQPLSIIEKLAEKKGLPKVLADEAKTSLEQDTAWGIINAFTSSAKRYDGERRIEVEQFAGWLLDHPELMDLANLDKVDEIKASGFEIEQAE